MSKIQITPKYYEVKPSCFYVYIHRRATDLSEFYVGRGRGSRGWQAYSGYRSEWWLRTADKHGVVIEVVQEGLTTDDADLLEEWLIAKLRHERCRLVNVTSGGGGTVGWVPTAETRARIGAAHAVRVECSNGICFPSMTVAAAYMSDNGYAGTSQASISQAVSGAVNTCCGMSWWLCGDFEKPVVTRSQSMSKTRGTPVIRSDGTLFDSLSSAVRILIKEGHLGASAGSLHSGIGNGRIRYGYTWRYAEPT